MKIILKLLMMIGMVVFYSCSSSQNITVKGTPGTEIYSPANTKLGVIDSAGELKVSVPNGGRFYHYLLSGKVGEGKLVPFALNYKHSGNSKLQNAMILGGADIALGGAIIAGISVGTGEGETGDITAMGLGGMAVGALIGGIGQLLSNMNNGEYEYRYLSYQKTNEDLAFLPIQDTGYKKGVESVSCVVDDTPNRRVKASASVSSDNQTSASKRQIKKDVSKFVSGSYIGTGSLSQKGKIVEEYDLVKVLITRIDNANVLIDVVEGGESFFSSKIRYQVVKKGKNTYVLSLNGVPGASIIIDANGRLTFMHPKVNIEGELYTLNINAEKE